MVGNDAEIHPFVRVCHSEYGVHFSWTLYIIEGVLLAFGAFLAFESRHVSIQLSVYFLLKSLSYPYKPIGISQFYQLDQSIPILRDVGWYFSLLFKFQQK